MLTRLNKSLAVKNLSEVTQPYLISVEADIPEFSSVVLTLEGSDHKGRLWRRRFFNPVQQVIPTLLIRKLWLELVVPKGNLSVPFINSVIVEGNGWSYCYDATALFDSRESKNLGQNLQLFSTKEIEKIDRFASEFNRDLAESSIPFRTYLTWTPIPGALVTQVETKKPYVLEVDGGGFGESVLTVGINGVDSKENSWDYTAEVRGTDDVYPYRGLLPISSWGNCSFGLSLQPSPDGSHAPSFHGIAIEGDGRRFYVGAAAIVGENQLPENLILRKFSNSPGSVLTIQHKLPDFFGFPSALEKLHKMFAAGEFVPDAAHTQFK